MDSRRIAPADEVQYGHKFDADRKSKVESTDTTIRAF